MTRILQSNHIQPFAFTAPAATSVQLVGDFTHWLRDPINLSKSSKGIWRINVALAPGTHRYKFLVNGQWHDGPEYVIRVGNLSESKKEFSASEKGLRIAPLRAASLR